MIYHTTGQTVHLELANTSCTHFLFIACPKLFSRSLQNWISTRKNTSYQNLNLMYTSTMIWIHTYIHHAWPYKWTQIDHAWPCGMKIYPANFPVKEMRLSRKGSGKRQNKYCYWHLNFKSMHTMKEIFLTERGIQQAPKWTGTSYR